MLIKIPNEKISCSNFIGNQFHKGGGSQQTVISPYTGQVIGEFNDSTASDVDQAVQKGIEAQKSWAELPLKERSKVMFNFRTVLLRDIDMISHVIGAESGKTFAEAKAGLMKGIEVLEFALAIQNLDKGGKMEVSRGVHCEYRREPLGVIANITPFNFPAMVPMWTIPIAITVGNSYLWKPSDKTPLTSNLIAKCFLEAGLPAGIFQIVQGGRETVEAVIDHPGVKAIGFVGSSKVAKLVYQRGTFLGKRVLALGGAKNHIVLLPDANPELTGPGISDSFTGCAGQRCMAASVVLAVGDVDHHIQRIVSRSSSLKLGQDMGAIITKTQVEFLKAAIGRAERSGAKILLDGRNAKPPLGFESGNWIGPTVIDFVGATTEASTEELFGPIISIVRCKTIKEALEIENKNPYGNACSVFTSSGALAEKVIQSAKSGMVGVNIGVPVPREPFAFGGVNTSKYGHGDITGESSIEFWTDVKKVTTKWEPQTDQNWMS